MGSSILSEVDNTSISGWGSQTRQRFPLSRLPVSRLLPPRSGLERSDFVPWSLLFTAIIAVVRQKFHLSSCPDFRDRLSAPLKTPRTDNCRRRVPAAQGPLIAPCRHADGL